MLVIDQILDYTLRCHIEKASKRETKVETKPEKQKLTEHKQLKCCELLTEITSSAEIQVNVYL